jgi:hypothetical protein
MARPLFWRSVVLVSCAGALALLGARSSGQDPESKPTSMTILKIGAHYINPYRITYATDNGQTLVVHFGDGASGGLRLGGDDAELMRKWLNARLLRSGVSPSRKPIMEGVDINTQQPTWPSPVELRPPSFPPPEAGTLREDWGPARR